MKKALIVGATGFGGLGLIEILTRHPGIEICQLVARKDSGKPVSDVFPHLAGHCDMTVQSPEEINLDNCDIAFFSTPDRAGMTLIGDFHKRGIPVIDFSGDFRFNSTEDYVVYARNKGMDEKHLSPGLLNEAVYGLPEKYRDRIAKARIVGNPGCFATCMILGLLPAAELSASATGTFICDGKTGVSGAGKNSGEANLYPQRHENVNTYREGAHQHLVEVENIINEKERGHRVFFVPQIVPMNRGILITIYSPARPGLKTTDVIDMYRNYYASEPFVRIVDRSPGSADVRGSNRCCIRPMIDDRTGMLFITSVIDNLIKGQAGNAVQNANIMLGFDETTALEGPAFYP